MTIQTPPLPPPKPQGQLVDTALRYHFLGIGGVGMSGLAVLLHHMGIRISGSDKESSPQLNALEALGIPVTVGHEGSGLEQADAVVYSSALKPGHPVWRRVEQLGKPRIHRAELLGAITAKKQTLAVAGTHGKTTSSACLAQTLAGMGLDPTALVGGHLPQWGGSNILIGGDDRLLVVEADESDGSFVHFHPAAVLLTNIEADHLDHHGSLENVVGAFQSFVARLKPQGLLVYCADSPLAVKVGQGWTGPRISYGAGAGAKETQGHPHVRVTVENMAPGSMDLRLDTPWGERRLTTPLGGAHNGLNLAGVAALVMASARRDPRLAMAAGPEDHRLMEALGGFTGVARRQEYLGEAAGFRLFDDYAHHPTEVRVTLDMFRRLYGGPLTVIFQPHLYSRTLEFAGEFAQALSLADRVIVVEVYAAREAPIPGVSGRTILEHMQDHPAADYIADWRDIPPLASRGGVPRGVVITMGAGDIHRLGPALLERLKP